MMSTIEMKVTLLTEHVDSFGRLRLSVLMRLFQEISIAHAEEMGYGKAMTLDKGLLWVIASERLQFLRTPTYGEEITLVSYPGPSMHSFFSRYLKVLDEDGNIVIKGSSIWTILDQNTRTMIDPKTRGIEINGELFGDEISPLLSLPVPALDKKAEATALYSLCDLNGHINNTHYADICFDILDSFFLKEHPLKEFSILFKKEIKLGEKFAIEYGEKEEGIYFKNGRFSMKVSFEK